MLRTLKDCCSLHRTCFCESIINPGSSCWTGLNRTLDAEWRGRVTSLALLGICPSLQHRTLLDVLSQGPLKAWPSRTSGCFPPGQLQPMLVPGVVPSQVQDFALPFLNSISFPSAQSSHLSRSLWKAAEPCALSASLTWGECTVFQHADVGQYWSQY